MKCPKDGAVLQIADRQGVEIDYCPECRGVWLDRGELDKIIERVAAYEQGSAAPPIPQQVPSPPPQRDYARERDWDEDAYKKRKRRGLLGEIFDFD